jgi:hypothetical protein
MSTINEITKTGNNIVTNYDTTKIALGDNKFITAEYTSTDAITIPEGTVFGRIHATGKIAILDKDANNGSAYPVGVFYNGIGGSKTVGATTTVELTLINKGSIDASKLAFAAGTTIDSVVGVKQIKDWLNDLGLVLVSGSQLTAVDNQ